MNTPSIFSNLRLGTCRLKNRLVALPVYTGYAHPDGTVSAMMVRHYGRLADSGVSLVVVANAAVSPDGVVSTYNLRIDEDRFIPGLARLAQAIKAGGALACLQLNHAGRYARTEQPLLPSPVDPADLPFNVSSLKDFMNFFPFERRFALTGYLLKQINTWRRPMGNEDRRRIISSFTAAAIRARQAGFDMIELHGAGGYLLCQFLSRFSHKTDTGSESDFEKRTTFPLAVVREIRRRLPEGYPVGFRLILREWVPVGIEPAEAIAFAGLLEKEGIAYLSASAATYHSMFAPSVAKTMARPGYLRADTAALTRSVAVPTIISGRIIRPKLAEKLLAEMAADLIGLGRPIRTDPMWIAKARSHDKKITVCINCNSCLKRVVLNQGFSCRRWPRELREKTDLEQRLLSRNARRLFVVSGGDDLRILRDNLVFLLQEPKKRPDAALPTILFLTPEHESDGDDTPRGEFLAWANDALSASGFGESKLEAIFRPEAEPPDRSVLKVIEGGGHGVVLACRRPDRAWPQRLLYRTRGRVVGLIGTHRRRNRVLVPVDMSMATLLALMFLKQDYVDRPGIECTFIHVLGDRADPVEQRWRDVKKIVGLDENLPLRLVPSTDNVAAALLETIKSEDFGTVLMGKRGLSMIKRWLLGSVSAGVLRGLTEQTILLID